VREHLYFYKVIDFPSIYDADSMTAAISVGFHMTARIPCRLASINAPELTEPERAQGLVARDYLRERLGGAVAEGREIIMYSHKRDKYGRWLITLFVDGVNINDELVEKGYAQPYGG
jgi:micrococcal nuclease